MQNLLSLCLFLNLKSHLRRVLRCNDDKTQKEKKSCSITYECLHYTCILWYQKHIIYLIRYHLLEITLDELYI